MILKACSLYCLSFQIRLLYSKTGVWPKFLDNTLKNEIENFWHPKNRNKILNDNKESFYLLSMIPYPSGNLHMGHVRVYVSSDCIARYQKMIGRNVVFPMGWDSFGLPAENAAIQKSVNPKLWTEENINTMKEQLKQLCCNFDWNREIFTSHPSYYKWTQYLFIKIFEAGLAYQRWADVDWDPVDKTVLAREQVDENGCSWRSGAKVVKKRLKQWFFKTTSFAKELYEDLDGLDVSGWRDVGDIQREWIGQCDGTNVDLPLKFDSDPAPPRSPLNPTLSLFTKCPEIFENAAFNMAIAIKRGHELDLAELYETPSQDFNEAYLIKLKSRAQNPFNPDIRYPIYVTDMVDFDAHTDAKLGTPFEPQIAKKTVFNNILSTVFAPQDGLSTDQRTPLKEITIENCDNVERRSPALQRLRSLRLGGFQTSARLKDWLVSRQRSWGTPIPILHCPRCQHVQPVAVDKLPVLVNYKTSYQPLPSHTLSKENEGGENIAFFDRVNVPCSNCQHEYTLPDPDTLDTFVDSAWYFMRFLDPKCESLPFRKELTDPYMPVSLYVGGKEHACLHLFFARFLQHFLHSQGLTDHKEPFKSLLMMGQITNKSYRVLANSKYVHKNDVVFKGKNAYEKATKLPLEVRWEKMSKSKLNGIDPAGVIAEHGVDTTRLLVLAEVTPTSPRSWDQQHFKGVLNFQSKLWMTIHELRKQRLNPREYPQASMSKLDEFEDDLREKTNQFIAKINLNFQQNQLSLVITQLEIFCQHLRTYPLSVLAHSGQFDVALAKNLIVLQTMAPSFANELWAGIKSLPKPEKKLKPYRETEIIWDKELIDQTWPIPDPSFPIPCIMRLGEYSKIFSIPNETLNLLSSDDKHKVWHYISTSAQGSDNHELLQTLKHWAHSLYDKCRNFEEIKPLDEIATTPDLGKIYIEAFDLTCQRLEINDADFKRFLKQLIHNYTHLTIYPNGGLYLTLDTQHTVCKSLGLTNEVLPEKKILSCP